uniref:Ubiquitin carboxyl-terminal hydrolase MINDY n=1 Tax=Periophthalmus magnuspinnatus TaxID=409849 RepID=A0A3B4AEX9_9GOBI
NMAISVEEVSSSLVREYLSRKGLKKTIACMDEEHPRTEASINNRSHLRQILHLDPLYKRKAIKPSQTTLLVPDQPESVPNNQSSLVAHDQKGQTLMASQDPEHFNAPVTESTKRKKTSRIRRGMMPGPVASTPEVPNTVFFFNFVALYCELKVVLLGSSLNCFSVEWRNQGFTFSETHDLRYGIVQKKGGPCGVLASVQGFVLKKMLFETSDPSNTFNKLKPSNSTRRKCLVLAIVEILWKAGEEKHAIVAIYSGTKHFIPVGQYKSEGVLEKVFSIYCCSFETEVLGCLLLVVSAVLSRSIEKVREDMDVPTTTLIGAHGYCTQELVNLLLCGQAVSNVFDNDMELDSGNGNITLLKGIKDLCEIGFLSLFEHYNICKVGSHLKTPRFPIWVVCSESHFSVLFGLQRELLISHQKGQEFDLYYYDGLSNQQEEIRLNDATELIPPLELCIRTRLGHLTLLGSNSK